MFLTVSYVFFTIFYKINYLFQQDVCIVNGRCFDIKHKNCANMDQNKKNVVTEQKQNGIILIVGGLIGGICFLIVVVLVTFKIYRHKR